MANYDSNLRRAAAQKVLEGEVSIPTLTDDSIPLVFRQAVAAFEDGQRERATLLCSQILAYSPDHVDALHLSGVLAMQRGEGTVAAGHLARAAALDATDAMLMSNLGSALEAVGDHSGAVAAYDQALAIRPDFVIAHFNRGNALKMAGRLTEAVTSYEKALQLQPDYAQAHANRAIALHEAGYPHEALVGYEHALALRPDHAATHCNRARVQLELGLYDAALASCDRAALLAPTDATILCDRGALLQKMSYPEAALVSLDRAIQIDPGQADAHMNRGYGLLLIEQWHRACEAFDNVIAMRPDDAAAWCGRGIGLRGLGRLEEAMASLDRALELRADFPEGHLNYGNVLLGLERPEEALECFDRALHLRPNYPDAFLDRGVALQELLRLDEAVVDFDRALVVKPGWADAGMNKAITLALLGRWTEAWACYEARKRRRSPSGVRPSPGVSARPLLRDPAGIEGKHVFLYWEQGYGDTIQFCRYVRMVQDRSAKVSLSVQDPLVPLLRNAFPGVQVLGGNEEPRVFDVHCPLLDLPGIFSTTVETTPAERAYLTADPEAVDRWATHLGRRCKTRIGIAWSGRADHVADYKRSIPLETLAPLLDYPADWIALQKDVRPTDSASVNALPQLRMFCDDLNDYADTAALIAQLDLVICVDTSVAHLAAAMGKPVWMMVARCPDWRWMIGRNDTPWYPTMRLFRQPSTNSWPSVVKEVASVLANVATGHATDIRVV